MDELISGFNDLNVGGNIREHMIYCARYGLSPSKSACYKYLQHLSLNNGSLWPDIAIKSRETIHNYYIESGANSDFMSDYDCIVDKNRYDISVDIFIEIQNIRIPFFSMRLPVGDNSPWDLSAALEYYVFCIRNSVQPAFSVLKYIIAGFGPQAPVGTQQIEFSQYVEDCKSAGLALDIIIYSYFNDLKL